MSWVDACAIRRHRRRGRDPLRPRRPRPSPSTAARKTNSTRPTAFAPTSSAPGRRAGDGQHHRVPQAQRPLRLHDRPGQGRAGLRQPQDLSGQGRGRHVLIDLRLSRHDRRRAWSSSGRAKPAPAPPWRCARHGYCRPVTLIGDEPHRPYERPPLSKAAMTAETRSGRRLSSSTRRRSPSTRSSICAGAPVVGDRAAAQNGRGSTTARKLRLRQAAARHRRRVRASSPCRAPARTTCSICAPSRTRSRCARRLATGRASSSSSAAASSASRSRRAPSRAVVAVTLVEMAPRLLMRGVPAEVAALVQARHERAGVGSVSGSASTGSSVRATAEAVVLADGTRLACDAIIAGVGAVPGNRPGDGERPCDRQRHRGRRAPAHQRSRHLRGRRLLLVSAPALRRPAAAARSLAQRPGPGQCWRRATCWAPTKPIAAVPWFWSDQYDADPADRGPARRGRDDGGARSRSEAKLFFHLAPDGRLVAASGIGPNRHRQRGPAGRNADRALRQARSARAPFAGHEAQDLAGVIRPVGCCTAYARSAAMPLCFAPWACRLGFRPNFSEPSGI